MKIVANTSPWQTRHLHAIIRRALRGVLDPAAMKRVAVTVRHSNGRLSGHAYLSGTKMHLSVPYKAAEDRRWLRRQLAAVAVHEAWHLRGRSHAVFPPNVMWCWHTNEADGTGKLRHPWVDAMPLDEKLPVRKAARPSTDSLLEHTRKKATEWNRKAEAARRRALAWERRVNAIERRMEKEGR